MNLDDLYRLLQNLIRVGTVAEVRHARPPRVRVETGQITTTWLPWIESRGGSTRTWSPPTLGEQVIVLSPGGDLTAGVVLPSVDQDASPRPSENPNELLTEYPDGAQAVYNHATGAMTITGIRSLLVEAADSVRIASQSILLDAPQTSSTGTHTVEGLLRYLAGLSGKDGQGNSTTITGNLTHESGNLSSNGVVVHLHVHGGVMPGGSDTEGPK